MNTYGRFTAAAGSIVLNVVLALILTQEAGAATPAANETVRAPHTYTVYVGTDHQGTRERCTVGIRTRAVIAVVLALIV